MAGEFLSDEQVASYGRFIGPLGRELERFFFLDDADRGVVAHRRGDRNRLGFAVQLGTVRALGTFLADPLDVPTEAVDYLAEQLRVADPSCVKAYGEREKTRPTVTSGLPISVWIAPDLFHSIPTGDRRGSALVQISGAGFLSSPG